ncbi:MAG TPA: glycosyl transferase family 2 [Niallia sp.]|nr:glycosyl transferase family 2 [Niallia sp.]
MLNNYENYRINYYMLKNFRFPQSEAPFLLTVMKENVKFEFLIRLKQESEKAIVFGSGAYDATSDLEPPIFQRHKWVKHFKENLIYYNDPTLYHGQINMGWGFGFEDRFYLEEIADILGILLDKASIKRTKTLFYGSSAGGYMSLLLGGLLKDSKVLVNNPQTIVWNYYDRHVNAMFSSAHHTLTRDEIIERYAYRLSSIEFYRKINYIPEVIYLQNVASERDLTHHLNPFITGLEQLDEHLFTNNITIRLYSDKKSGHSPLNLEKTVANINEVVQTL